MEYIEKPNTIDAYQNKIDPSGNPATVNGEKVPKNAYVIRNYDGTFEVATGAELAADWKPTGKGGFFGEGANDEDNPPHWEDGKSTP